MRETKKERDCIDVFTRHLASLVIRTVAAPVPSIPPYVIPCSALLRLDQELRRIYSFDLTSFEYDFHSSEKAHSRSGQVGTNPRIVLVLRVSPWNNQKREYLSAFLTKVALPWASSAIYLTSLDNVGRVACWTEHVSFLLQLTLLA